MSTPRTLLVIGYGNSLRRDDGAGLLLADLLYSHWEAQGRPVRLLLAHQLGPEMALDIAAPDIAAVLFVDAAAAGRPLVELEPVYPAAEHSPLTHYLSPATLLLYAECLFDHHPDGWMMRITGQDFDHGDTLSPAVAESVAVASAQADHWWKRIWPNGAQGERSS